MKKSFKIVFASLLVAALGIVGFSSFKGSETKAFDPVTVYLQASSSPSVYTNWSSTPNGGCSGVNFFCSITYNDNDMGGLSEAELIDLVINQVDPGDGSDDDVEIDNGDDDFLVDVQTRSTQ